MLQGHYCPEASEDQLGCPPGSYMELSGGTHPGPGDYPACTLCPGGSECPGATVSPITCSAGYFSYPNSSACELCLPGYYCDGNGISYATLSVSKRCTAGLYCPEGMNTPPSSPANDCPLGHECPEAISAPTPCPPGTYASERGMATCDICPAGSYCIEGAIEVTGYCQAGFYCPAGSSATDQEPCPAGTFRNHSGATAASDCGTCPEGYYCPMGSPEPLLCPEGNFCPCGVGIPIPCPIGTIGRAVGLISQEECEACPPGQYCDRPGLSNPAGLCSPGYYCTLGSYTSTPPFLGPPHTDSSSEIGGICPPRGYCEPGSSEPTPCPPGTYLNETGKASVNDCLMCTPGWFCNGTASAGPVGLCEPGYYCPGGAENATQVEAPIGHYTGYGDSQPIPCPPGTYNPETAQPECRPCEEGYYCPALGNINITICPAGFYCAQGTAIPKACPAGRFSEDEGLTHISECELCTAGSYCASQGLTAPTGLCTGGYYCSGGEVFPNPINTTSTGGPCPAGYYCPPGSAHAEACPSGTYQPGTRKSSSAACLPCSAGKYCSGEGKTQESGPCSPGYYCTIGASISNPDDGVTGDICPPGYECPEGSYLPMVCLAGTYAGIGSPACLDCSPGYYCEGNATYEQKICPVGAYCPGNSSKPIKCPPGTYQPNQNAELAEECLPCTPGFYCPYYGMDIVEPSFVCEPGFVCESGTVNRYGGRSISNTSTVPCPKGHYCPEGSGSASPCPLGTFNPSRGSYDPEDCQFCTHGHYCNSSGAAAIAGDCEAGYYCKLNVTTPRPLNGVYVAPSGDEFGGDICPTGAWCPEGTTQPIKCEPGTYNDDVGATSNCTECPRGFYCTRGTSFYSAFPCPSGYYCPEGTEYATQFPCGPGTYNSLEGQSSEDACVPCDPGSYCSGQANSVPDGLCAEGFFCRGGARVPAPADGNVTGGACDLGQLCPAGSAAPLLCPGGFYCNGNYSKPT